MAGGKYQILRVLGEGGMGAVYQALQPAMNRMVALKLIRPEMGLKPDAIARFHREMMVTARIEHPNTIRLYDFGEDGGQLFLVMELLAGTSLGQVIDSAGKLALPRIIRIGRQVANALGAVHAHGVVHRDLKPDNVMLLDAYGERDFVKVLDFGIAKSLDEDPQLTGTGKPIGTPAYMSPEQAMGRPVDHRTDLYAFGVMLYRMASGRAPFDAPSMVSMLMAHATEVPPPIASLAPEISPALAALIMQLLEKEPEARPANAAEVGARLDGCLPGGGLAAGSLSPGDVSANFAFRGAPRAAPGMATRRRSWVLALAGGAVVAVAIAIAAYAIRAPGAAPPAHDAPTTPSATPTSPGPAAASRQALDELLTASEPLAPEPCRATDAATIGRLLQAAHALGPPGASHADADAAGAADQVRGILGETPGPSTEAWALLSRAQLAHDPEQAQASAAEAVRLCPGYAVAHNVSGNALQKLGKAQLAEDAYVRALTAAPMYDAPRFNLGLLQLRQNDATAIGTFTELLRRRPDHPNAHLARAQAYAAQGQPEQALADLEEAVRQQPDSAEAWASLGELRERLKLGDAQDAYCRAKQLGHAKAALHCR
ncbi:MAG TPA: protein kinase [Kofleriaceae bacterium]|nr:protein kinase [Kofleriaceae bacterium]